jgi:FXSXX-COOH protein
VLADQVVEPIGEAVNSTDDYESHLVDLAESSLADLQHRNESALQRSLCRVLEDAENPQDAFAGFNSAL